VILLLSLTLIFTLTLILNLYEPVNLTLSITPTTTQIQSLFVSKYKPVTFRPCCVAQHSVVVTPATVNNDPNGKLPIGTISDATFSSREIVEVPLFVNTDSTACWINTVMHVMLGACFQFLSLLSVALH
jgi:hypothetical protein